MGKDIELAILFADVVGSTRLFEELGDVRARDMIATCIDVMRTATERMLVEHRRNVRRGDGSLAALPDADEGTEPAADQERVAS